MSTQDIFFVFPKERRKRKRDEDKDGEEWGGPLFRPPKPSGSGCIAALVSGVEVAQTLQEAWG